MNCRLAVFFFIYVLFFALADFALVVEAGVVNDKEISVSVVESVEEGALVDSNLWIDGEPMIDDELTIMEGLRVKYYGGTCYSYWFPADDDDSSDTQHNALDYQVEGLSVYQVGLRLTDGEWTPLHIFYKSSMENSSNQDRILEKKQDASVSFKDFYVAIDPFCLFLDLDPSLCQQTRFHFRCRKFAGIAVAKVDRALFIADSGEQFEFNRGDTLSVEADFFEWGITLPLMNPSVRSGLYLTKSRKPYETSFYTTGFDAVTVDMEIYSGGLMVLLENDNLDMELKMGVAKFHANQNLSAENPFDGYGFDFMFRLELHPQIWASGNPDRCKIKISPLVGAQFRMQTLDVGDENYGVLINPGPGEEINLEILVDLGLKIEF